MRFMAGMLGLAMAACGSGEGRFAASQGLEQDGGAMAASGAGGGPLAGTGGASATGGSPAAAGTGGSAPVGGAGTGGAVGVGGTPTCSTDAQCAAGDRCAETRPRATTSNWTGHIGCLMPCHMPVDNRDTTGCRSDQWCKPVIGQEIVSACRANEPGAGLFCVDSFVASACDTLQ